MPTHFVCVKQSYLYLNLFLEMIRLSCIFACTPCNLDVTLDIGAQSKVDDNIYERPLPKAKPGILLIQVIDKCNVNKKNVMT